MQRRVIQLGFGLSRLFVAAGMIAVLAWFAGPATAACVIVGSGTQTSLQSGDAVACTGAGNTFVQTTAGQTGVTVDIGDGTTATTLDGGASVGVLFASTSNGTITVFDQAEITSDNTGIVVSGGAGNVVNVSSGATLSTTSLGSTALSLDGSNGNVVNIGGTIGDLTAGTRALDISSGAANNLANILSGGLVQGSNAVAVNLIGAGDGNIIYNAGTISSTTNLAIQGSSNDDVVVNEGTLSGNYFNRAVDMGDGADVFQLRDGSSITGWVIGGAGTDTLSFGGNSDSAFDLSNFGSSAQFREFEALTKWGNSAWTLTGTTTDAATMDIHQGRLVVNGSMENVDTTVSGGTLGGSGTVGGVTVNSGGTVAPGNSIGTLNVAGNATFNAGSTYQVEVDAGGQADLLLATGMVTINGGTVAVLPFPDYAVGNAYTIITAAGGVTGTFDAATFSLLFVTPTLTYDANNVYMTLTQTANLVDWAVTPNQIATAGAIDALGAGNAVFDAAIMLGSSAAARAAFDALSGEGHASLKGVLIEDSAFVRDAVLGRLGSAAAAPDTAGAAMGYAGDAVLSGESAYGGGVWGQLYGGLGNIAADGNAARTDFASGGLVLGTDGELGDWRLGLVANAGMTGVFIPDRDTSGTSADYGVGLYGGTKWGDTGFAFGAAYTRHAISTTREASFPGFTDALTASHGAATGQVFGEINHEFDLGDLSFTPFAQLAYVNHATDAFTEQGGAAALSSAASVVDGTFTTLGLRGSRQFVVGEDGLGTLSGGLAWRHAFADTPAAVNTFAGGAAFTVSGAPIAADALVLEAGLDLDLANGMDLALGYDGQIAASGQSHALKARVGGQF